MVEWGVGGIAILQERWEGLSNLSFAPVEVPIPSGWWLGHWAWTMGESPGANVVIQTCSEEVLGFQIPSPAEQARAWLCL